MEGTKISLNEDKDKDKESDILPKKRAFPKRLKKFTGDEEDKKVKKKKKITEINEQLEEGFMINVQGMIEIGEFFEGDVISCKYDIEFGRDWELLSGEKTNVSQQACKTEGKDNYFIWNMPFEVCLKSTNPSGWPQLVISCYSPDFFGREVLKAYGVCYFPTTKGSHERTLHMFSVKSSSGLIEAIGVFLGQKAEILNAPNVLATGEGREVIRAQSEGTVKVKFNINITNMDYFGYNQ